MGYAMAIKEIANQERVTLIQHFPSPSTYTDENYITMQISSKHPCSVETVVDLSSICSQNLRVKTETFLTQKLATISEENAVMEIESHDFVVKMPPKKRYKVRAHVKGIRKGKPGFIGLDDF